MALFLVYNMTQLLDDQKRKLAICLICLICHKAIRSPIKTTQPNPPLISLGHWMASRFRAKAMAARMMPTPSSPMMPNSVREYLEVH